MPVNCKPNGSGTGTLLEHVDAQVRGRVMASQEGDMLFEAGLARELGASRSLVRLTMTDLATRGFIRRIPGKGIVVTQKVREHRTVAFAPTREEIYAGIVEPAVANLQQRFPNCQVEQRQWLTPQDDVRGILEERVHSRANFIQPIDPVLEQYPDLALSNFRPEAVDLFRNDGKVLALPLTCSATVMHLNREAFDRAGLGAPGADWSWEDLLRMAPVLQEKGGVQAALASSSPPRLYLTMAHALGAEIVAEPGGAWNLQCPAALEAARLYARLRPWTIFSDHEVARLYAQGQIAMYPRAGQLPSSMECARKPWMGLAPMPRGTRRFTWVASRGLGLGRYCRNVELAGALIHELIGAASQKAAFQAGLMAPSMKGIGEPIGEETLYWSEMAHARPLYELTDREVYPLVNTQLDHLKDPAEAAAFCRHTERIINDFLAHRQAYTGEEAM